MQQAKQQCKKEDKEAQKWPRVTASGNCPEVIVIYAERSDDDSDGEVSINNLVTNISNHSLIDMGPQMTKKTMGHRPVDSAQAKLKPIRDGSADCDF